MSAPLAEVAGVEVAGAHDLARKVEAAGGRRGAPAAGSPAPAEWARCARGCPGLRPGAGRAVGDPDAPRGAADAGGADGPELQHVAAVGHRGGAPARGAAGAGRPGVDQAAVDAQLQAAHAGDLADAQPGTDRPRDRGAGAGAHDAGDRDGRPIRCGGGGARGGGGRRGRLCGGGPEGGGGGDHGHEGEGASSSGHRDPCGGGALGEERERRGDDAPGPGDPADQQRAAGRAS